MNRRDFILGAASAASFPLLGGSSDEVRLRVGIVTDTHVENTAHVEHFESALRYFRDRGVDAVMHVGDISGWGLVADWKAVAAAWGRVFPGSRGSDGQEVVRLFTTGNHDFAGWRYETDELHAHGCGMDETLARNDLPKLWKECFGIEFAPVTRWTVKGYDFLSCHWSDRRAIVDWMKAHGGELDPSRPFFFFQHGNAEGTVAGGNWGDKGAALEAFANRPNAVVIGGHTHLSMTDEHQIWQGAFTAIGVGSMSWTELPFDCENGRPRDPKTARIEQMLPLDDRVRRTNRQGLVMSVYDDRIVFERRDFTNGVELGDPWIVPIPIGRGKPYAWDVRATTMPVPQFAPGATVEAKTLVGRDRRYNLSIQMALDFPTARYGGVRAYDYEIRSETERGVNKVLCRIVSPTYNRGPSCECAAQRALVSVRELPEGTPYRFVVYPRNCFGVAGEPIRSCVWTRHPAEEIPE